MNKTQKETIKVLASRIANDVANVFAAHGINTTRATIVEITNDILANTKNITVLARQAKVQSVVDTYLQENYGEYFNS